MATVNVMLNTRRADRHSRYPIIIKVRDKASKREINTGWKVELKYWKDGQVTRTHPDAALINASIEATRAEIMRTIYDATVNRKRLRLDLIGRPVQSHCFINYLLSRAQDYRNRGKRTMEIKTKRFAKELTTCFDKVYFSDIDMDWLRRFDTWLIEQKNVANTRRKKFAFFRGFYQNAIDEGKADAPNPFKTYKINPDPVKKEKLTLAQLQAIEALPLMAGPVMKARDLFLLSFYCKGMRFENCILLQKDNIRDGRILWQSNKGHKHLSVAIHPKLQEVLNRLSLPLLQPTGDLWSQKKQIESMNVVINRNLKIVAAMASIPFNLTFHIARHSFAFLLKQKSNNIHVIKDALGHSDTRTTEMYLRSLDDEAIDQEVGKVYDY